jgi:DNA-binding GntR family transcriptional regulator
MEDTGVTKPRGERIRGDIAQQIQDGTYAVGDQLPTLEALARAYNVSAITVSRALKPLRDSGVITGVQGAGMWIGRVPTSEDLRKPDPAKTASLADRVTELERNVAEVKKHLGM